MPSTSNSLWYDATSTCLYSKDLMNDGTCGCSRPNSCVRKKKNRSENQRRHRIKNAAFPQLRYLNEIDTDALPARSAEGLSKPLRHLISPGKGATSYYTGIPVPERPICLQPWGIAACNVDTRTVHFSAQTAYADKGMPERNDTKGTREQVRTIRHGHLRRVRYVSCDKAGAEMLFNHLSLRTDKKTNCHYNKSRISTDGTRLLQTKY